ncbi:MAG: hypothetical protein QOG10_6015, partial [Kribbellaceae bacterium]|nr:hypothetical protein [Kribbellaceae bacterium]
MTARPVFRRTIRRTAGPAGLLAAATVLALTGAGLPSAAAGTAVTPPGAVPAGSAGAAQPAAVQAGSTAGELSETSRLADRRSLVTGDRAYAMGDETGLYPATGWHIRGEMGGIWTQPLKLLDGLWFGVDGAWLGKDVAAAKYTSGHGYQRISYPGDVSVERTDFVPDGLRATVVGLTFSSAQARTVKLDLDAHSELMSSYPWGWTTPNAGQVNL